MSETSTRRELVQRILAHETGEAPNQRTVEASVRACEKMRVHLSKRIGRDGFCILQLRALTLATAHFPQLGIVRVEEDGTLHGLLPTPLSPQETNETALGAEAVVENLVDLLVIFIGEDLTMRLLSAVWPTIDQNNTDNTVAATENEGSLPGQEKERV